MAAAGGRLLERGGAALQRGEWVEARAAFAAAVEVEQAPEALAGLGAAKWWLGEVAEALALWERAYAGYRRAGTLNDACTALAVSLGHQTALFDTMAGLPPSTSEQIAEAAGLHERYVREWLGAMTTARIVTYDAGTATYHLPAEHAAFLTRAAPSWARRLRTTSSPPSTPSTTRPTRPPCWPASPAPCAPAGCS